jgi:hypothetical protein
MGGGGPPRDGAGRAGECGCRCARGRETVGRRLKSHRINRHTAPAKFCGARGASHTHTLTKVVSTRRLKQQEQHICFAAAAPIFAGESSFVMRGPTFARMDPSPGSYTPSSPRTHRTHVLHALLELQLPARMAAPDAVKAPTEGAAAPSRPAYVVDDVVHIPPAPEAWGAWFVWRAKTWFLDHENARTPEREWRADAAVAHLRGAQVWASHAGGTSTRVSRARCTT